MRSISEVGMVDMSVKPARLVLQRLPLTSTSVRCSPRLYRLTYWPPCSGLDASTAALLKVWVPATDRFCSRSPTLTRPERWMSSWLTVRTGWEVSTSTERMREPVTSRRSRVVGALASCAEANAGASASAMPAGSRPSRTAGVRTFINLSKVRVSSVLKRSSTLRLRCDAVFARPNRRLCRMWREQAAVLPEPGSRLPVAGAEGPGEAAAVVESAGCSDLAHHHVGVAQQIGGPLEAQPCRKRLGALFIQALEGLGEVPAGEVGQLGEFADPHYAVAVALQIETGTLHAAEHLALAAERATGAAL